jgi:hypothetical protein
MPRMKAVPSGTAYIPTAAVLTELRKEGFQPFMVTQTRVRDEGKREHTKHMLRLRHASQINGAEANEIILLNSHDGTSSYQMLAGCSASFAAMALSAATPWPMCACPTRATWPGTSSKALTRC